MIICLKYSKKTLPIIRTDTVENWASWGGETQLYKFGGKEEETMLGLNQYDFTARTLDEYGRFTTIDPMAEKYYSISPYAYCGNNPILNVDPMGMDYTLYFTDNEVKENFTEFAY